MRSMIICTLAIAFAADVIPGICGENIWTSNGPPGASIICIEIRPDNPNIIYAGTIQNGIYRSTDRGETWSHFGQGLGWGIMRKIACNPLAPDTMYCGTVYGLYKSTDAGANWLRSNTPSDTTYVNEYRGLAVHPTSPNIIIAGGPFDAWKSTDSGNTWTIMTIPEEYGLEDVEFSLSEPNVVYLATQSNRYRKAVYKSTDTGDTWINVHNNLDLMVVSFDIEVDPTNSQIVYLGVREDGSAGHVISKTTDGGQTWFDVSPQGLTVKMVQNILVSPVNPVHIYACTEIDGVFESDNGGESWRTINDSLRVYTPGVIEMEPANGTLYLGCYNDGIYKREIGGFWQKIGYDIHLSWLISLACNPVNPEDLLATTLNGLFKSPDNGETWQYVNTGIPIREFPAGLIRDRFSPHNIYLSSERAYYDLVRAGFYKSTDNGLTWQPRRTGLPDSVDFLEIVPSNIDSVDCRLIMPSSSGLFYSDDAGESWLECAGGLPPALYYDAIAISPSDPNYIAVGELQRRLYISRDRANSWIEPGSLPMESYERIRDIEFDPNDPQIIYVASYPKALLKSTDGGQTWSDVSGNLPRYSDPYWQLIICDILINPYNPSNIFVINGGYGIYQTFEGGQSWSLFDYPGLPTSGPYGRLSFALDDTTTLHYLTANYSLWSIHRTLNNADNNEPVLPKRIMLSNYPNPFNSSTTISFILPKEERIALNLYDIAGRKVAVIDEGIYPAGSHSLNLILKDHASGIYYLRLDTDDSHITRKMVMIK